MDLLSFMSEIISSVAWPLAIGIFVIILRKPLQGLLPSLSHFKYGKFEAEFNKKLENADRQVQALSVVESEILTTKDEFRSMLDSLLDVVKKSPTVAVLAAWRAIEIELQKFASAYGKKIDKAPPWAIAQKLFSDGKITEEMNSALNQLHIVRNEAAHSRGKLEIGESQATVYIFSAVRIIYYFRNHEALLSN